MIKYRVLQSDDSTPYPVINDFKTKDDAKLFYAEIVKDMFDGEEYDNDDRDFLECIEDTETSMYDETVKVFEVWDDEMYPLFSWD